jgi:hypothetical protein
MNSESCAFLDPVQAEDPRGRLDPVYEEHSI